MVKSMMKLFDATVPAVLIGIIHLSPVGLYNQYR